MKRRSLLSVIAVAPLAACVREPEPSPPPSPFQPTPTPSLWPDRPGDLTSVEAVIFDGAFGRGYVDLAANALTSEFPSVKVTVSAVTNITAELAARFEDGATPPDLIDNSGADQLAVAQMVDDFLPLDDVIACENSQGELISDTLYANALDPGIVNDKLISIPYALSVYGLWYSGATFAEQGWAVPTAWDEMLALGAEAKAIDTFLFAWGDGAAHYYQELAISSAIKEGGDEVRVALDNLEPDGWSHPAVSGVLEQLEACVAAGLVLYGGAFQAAQAEWSENRRALFYPSGAWIVHEVADHTADGFEMMASPVPTLTSSPTLPIAAVHSTATEAFLVPARAANPEGGKALLRSILNPEVAQEFTRTNLMPTVVRNSVPTDLESSALDSQTRLLADAGDNVFSWRFADYYGLAPEQDLLWAQFLSGQLTALSLANQLQALSDRVRNDPTVERYTVS
uniref:N-acetylglucosamine/diacetylchitobiose ABC transporter substrate-binding protein n=1 Tax=Tessaracoccus bendigoensis TaxID=72764 RepID=UPI00158824ED|nr:N-acetylglucosamine/diacetylchitobiose ABC transporter substrate-binding protein [Tessaracoccus bendigoensis]